MSTQAVRAGKAEVELGLRDRLQRGLDAAAQRLRRFGTVVASIGAGMTAMGGAILAPFITAITAASELEETMNKFNVVFGDNAGAMKEWGDSFAKQVGRSKTEVAGFLASNQDLLVPMGLDPAAAEQMSQELLALTVDLASFNNLQDADVARDLQAALTGSGEVMKKYGVIVSEAAVKQQLLNDGINPKHATEAQKANARFAIILAGTTAAQGDAVRSGGSWANQLKRLQAAIKDTRAAIGTAILPAVTQFLSLGVKLVGNLQTWIDQHRELVLSVAAVGAGIVAAGAAISSLGMVAIAASIVLAKLALAFSGLLAIGAGILTFLVSPIGLLAVGVAAAGAAIFTMTDYGKDALSELWKLGDYVGGELWAAFEDIRQIGGVVFDGLGKALAAGDWEAAGEVIMQGLEAAWLTGVATLQGIWGEFTAGMIEAFAGAMIVVHQLWTNTQNKIANSLLDQAAEEGLMGSAARMILGVDMREENERTRKLEEERRRRGLTDETGSIRTAVQQAQQIVNQATREAQSQMGEYWGDVASEAKERSDDAAEEARQRAQDARNRLQASVDALPELPERTQTERTIRDFEDNMARQSLEGIPTLGTQSSYALDAMFAGLGKPSKPDEETAENTRRAAELLQEIDANLRNAEGLMFA